MFVLNVPAIIEYFNGVGTLAAGLATMGAKGCTRSAVEKWVERDAISIKNLLLLKQYAASKRKTFSVDSFIEQKAA